MATFTGTALCLHFEAMLQNLKEKDSNWYGLTYVMSFTSSPREATSVAMRILTKPLLNSSRAWIRSHCSLNTSQTHSTTSNTEHSTAQYKSNTQYYISHWIQHKSNTQYYVSHWIQHKLNTHQSLNTTQHKSNTQYYSSNWTQVKHTVLQQTLNTTHVKHTVLQQ